MLRLPDPVLLVLVGASGSGKSHWAGEHFRPEQVVSSDRLRAVVGEGPRDLEASADAFDLLERIVAARLGRRLTTVVDTLGFDDERRAAWLRLAVAHGMPCVAVAFDTEPAECRRRNAARGPADRLSQAVLTAQLKRYTQVRVGLAVEGFTDVVTPQPVRVVPAAFTPAAAPAAAPAPGPAGRASEPSVIRFGLQLSRWDVPGGPAELGPRLADVAARAEAAGFDSIWVMDHFRQIPQLGRAWEDMPESVATLGYLAAATRRATIGALVHGITYRNVAHLAKVVATLDVLSGGRARCGLGAAWFEAEHTAYGWPFPPAAERLDLLEDALQLLPLLWGPGAKPFTGRVLQVPDTTCYPRPLQAHVPVLVGGSGERRTLRLVARYADACNLTGDVPTVRRKLAVLAEHCATVGRDPADVETTHLSTVLVARHTAELDAELAARRPARGHARWAAATNPGTVEDHVLRARSYVDAGVQHLIVSPVGVWDSPALERYGEVIAAVRG
ncbi:TIGR03560 family F420-dependent LLM class oxidoreductase [Spongisporangium articulatum]|uniref:TIGR03560 family F420-dependent LLM class oxidoreductase n=1 Tax=Spongisporangium articulatum TaxID=3362603 RepID=A0ABW8AK99_9ACTN